MKSQNVSINEYFKKIGFNEEDIEFLNQFATNEIDLKILHEKIKYLIYLGLNARQIRIIIEEDLIFVTEPLELIKSNGTVLQKYLNEDEIASTLEVTPELLTVKEGSLEENIKLLKLLITNDEYLKIIIQNIEIFDLDNDEIDLKSLKK